MFILWIWRETSKSQGDYRLKNGGSSNPNVSQRFLMLICSHIASAGEGPRKYTRSKFHLGEYSPGFSYFLLIKSLDRTVNYLVGGSSPSRGASEKITP
jgi:hypothetical protein